MCVSDSSVHVVKSGVGWCGVGLPSFSMSVSGCEIVEQRPFYLSGQQSGVSGAKVPLSSKETSLVHKNDVGWPEVGPAA